MDRILDRSDDENNIFSEKPQSDFHHVTETTKWVREDVSITVGEERNFVSQISRWQGKI